MAIKVAPWAGTRLDARFRLERQILAGLDHPDIARFLDGGTAYGQPYFVMEFVDGVPLTTYCREHDLSVRDRLGLVRRVCAALDYAHQHLVVHRDLKPSNILVAADGTPKVLDFGIAKLLDPAAESGATLGVSAWTPDFASPEQVQGRPVSTRSDVYSLGLVLYEVLTGESGQRADTTSPASLTRTVCDEEPAPPSVRAAAAGYALLARELRGDLDTIVATAIQKEPDRRYASMAAFADDLGRYLDGLPVAARPSTWTYRASKLVARHRVAAVAAVLVAASIAGGTTAAVYQARRAERRFDQVRGLANAFVFDVHDRIASLPGATEARRAIVQTALTYLENLREDAAGDAALARELAAAYERIGAVQGHPLSSNLGEPEAALVSYARAEALLAPFESGGDEETLLRVASVSLQARSGAAGARRSARRNGGVRAGAGGGGARARPHRLARGDEPRRRGLCRAGAHRDGTARSVGRSRGGPGHGTGRASARARPGRRGSSPESRLGAQRPGCRPPRRRPPRGGGVELRPRGRGPRNPRARSPERRGVPPRAHGELRQPRRHPGLPAW